MSTSLHQQTPSLTVIDPRGLSVRTIAYHRRDVEEVIASRVHRQVFNANGHLSQQWDPRLLELSEIEVGVQPNQSTLYSLCGQVLQTGSVDAGERVTCFDAAGLLCDSWDGREIHRCYGYDELKRPVRVFEQVSLDAPQLCVERFTYAASSEEGARNNRCGQLIRHDDQAGSLWHEYFGLLALPITETRRFCTLLTSPSWPGSEDDLEIKTYTTHWRHDALGAVVEQTDALDHRQRFEVDVSGQPRASWLDGKAILKSTTYSACGQVETEQAGNDAITTAYYSPVDGLLCSLKAQAPGGKTLQDLYYQYDPVGNIKRIEDCAQPVQWFAQQRIQAVSTYTYDTLYQLTSATGRESISQAIGPGLPRLEIFGAADDSRWRNYNQTYTYDSDGNLTRLKHDAGAGNAYTREMVVDERSNRSLFKDNSPIDFAKAFDANGNQQALAPGQVMRWDTRNQLHQVTQVQRDDPGGQDDDVETYVYDGRGQRLRKVRRAKTRGGEQVSEVRYLPGLEIRTRTVGEQLHVVIAQAGRNGVRLLHWEHDLPKGIANDQLRYSLCDHLGSSTLELDQTGELISQESYYPYGGTAWWAAKSAIEAEYKVVRYSGKERDATGLYYYGFRYYASWLQRWISPDPAGDVDGLNRYRFVANSPIRLTDNDGRNFEDTIINTPFSRNESSGRFIISTMGPLSTSLAAEVAFSDEINLTEVHPMDMTEYVNRFDSLSRNEKVAIRGWSATGNAFEYHDRVDSDDYPDPINYEINQFLAENKPLDKYLMKAYKNLQSGIPKLTVDKAVLLRTDEYSYMEDMPWGKIINKGDIVTNGALLMAVSESNLYARKLTDRPEKETTITLAHFLIKDAEAAPLVYGIASPVLEEYERLVAPHAFFEVEEIAYAEKIDNHGITDDSFMKRVGVVLKQLPGHSGPAKNIHTGR
ncbi:RHS repeat domain-containing protein [Pseudomonas laurylsulfatiphila]|uniref:RHS repeat domain-containing protein n=1 Tax=Pseudomonas laurylsulfatiphila TaxID=2011015 RepID=UPI003D200BCF